MFILVTTIDGEKIILNSSAIQTIEQATSESIIYFSPNDFIEVRETLEQIYGKLKEKR